MDGLFCQSDLEGLSKREVRSASNDNHPIMCYLKSDVENRCVFCSMLG